MPASRAAWITATASSWSALPQAPNIIAPRQSGLTLTPVRPSVRSSIVPPLPAGRPARRQAGEGRCGDAARRRGSAAQLDGGVGLGHPEVERLFQVEGDVLGAVGEVADRQVL